MSDKGAFVDTKMSFAVRIWRIRMKIVHGALSHHVARFMALLLLGSFVLAGTSVSASAAEPRFDPTTVMVGQDAQREAAQQLVDKIQRFEAAYSEDTSDAGRRWTGRVRSHLEAGRLQVHLPTGARVVAAQAKVWVSSGSTDILVFLPFAGTVSTPSGLTVSLNAQGKVLGSMETVFQEVSETSGTVAVWYDGILKGHVLMNASGESVPVTEPAPAASIIDGWGDWWDAFEYCLTNIMAVPGWLITGLAFACSIGCYFSAGAACLACIAAAAGAYSFATGYCIAYAFDHS